MKKNVDLWSQLYDMQLIGKLAVSAAAVVLVTLAYKYYSTRKRTARKAKGYGSNGSEAILNLEEKEKIKDNSQFRDKVTEKHSCKDDDTELRYRHKEYKTIEGRSEDIAANSNAFGSELLYSYDNIKWNNVDGDGQDILLAQQEGIDISKLKFLEADLIQSTDFPFITESSAQQVYQTAEERKEDIHDKLKLQGNKQEISPDNQESIGIHKLKFLEADLIQNTDFITQSSLQQVYQTAEERKEDSHGKLNLHENEKAILLGEQEDIDIRKLKFLEADLMQNSDLINQISPEQEEQRAEERKEDTHGKLNVLNAYESETFKGTQPQNNISSRHEDHTNEQYDNAVSNKNKKIYDSGINVASILELLANEQSHSATKDLLNNTHKLKTIQGDNNDTPLLDLSKHMKDAGVVESRIKPAKDTSGIGMTLNQTVQKPGSVSTFSSLAEVQVEENYITEKHTESAGNSKVPSKKCIIYDYYVESASQSLEKDKSYMYEIQNSSPSLTHYTVTEELYELKSPSFGKESPEVKNGKVGRTSDYDSSGTASICSDSTVTSDPSSGEQLLDDLEVKCSPEVQPASIPPPSKDSSMQKNQSAFERKGSFYEIIDNPELQLNMDNFQLFNKETDAVLSDICSERSTSPRPSSGNSTIKPLHSSETDSKKEANVEMVARANFLQMPMIPDSSEDITKCKLDLGNCYDVLCMAKQRRLDDVQEAVYKVMSDNYLQALKDPSIYGNLKASERDLILEMRVKGKKYLAVADVDIQDLMQEGPLNIPKLDGSGMDPVSLTNTSYFSKLCYYDDQSNTWHFLASIPKEAVSNGCAICTMFNYLFIVAGCQGLGKDMKPTNRFFCYNPVTDIWREICPLNQARPQCRLVALDGYIYAIGGECLSTVERYDPKTDRWSFIAPLPNDIFAVGHFATVSNGEIYVSGGTLKQSVLRYNTKTDTWKESSACGTKDRTTDIISVKHFIYRFDLNRSMGISAYRCSASAKLWYECSVLRTPYPGPFQCTVIDNIICCVSRQFHKWFLADEIYPRFLQNDLKLFPSPKGSLFPLALVLPDKDTHQTRV